MALNDTPSKITRFGLGVLVVGTILMLFSPLLTLLLLIGTILTLAVLIGV